jgi:phage terminase Nu1 subunit (DNA packaging protein)
MRAAPDTTGCGEPWVNKRQIAAHLGVSIRFIETQHNLGLPVLRMGTINRYHVSEVEAWMRDYYSSTATLQEM